VPQDLFDLSGKVAVVTGGSRGLGREMVAAFAARGANVVIASRKVDACRELAREVAATTGCRAIGAQYHAGHWGDSERLVDEVYAEFGRCDVLVNNAGMSPLYSSLSDITEDLFDKVIGVNLKGPFRLSVLMGERMAASDGGSIINISSIAAVRPLGNELVYAAAKAGINVLTSGLAQAFAPKVRCNVIMPGPFRTDISKSWDMGEFEQMAANSIPLARVGEPHEIVGAALYLASAASSYTTGAIITVDGGWMASPA
jgi:NAD(P)-dependent dehydrogenase (short-subunit alcohol dehydrogenase family)